MKGVRLWDASHPKSTHLSRFLSQIHTPSIPNPYTFPHAQFHVNGGNSMSYAICGLARCLLKLFVVCVLY
jgi:hypothetical protein